MDLLFEKKDQPLVEEIVVLIPEARANRRRRWLRTGTIIVVTVAVVLLLSLYVGGVGARPSPSPSPNSAPAKASIAPLAVGTMINASSVTAIQMFSASRGVAISTFWNKGFTSIDHSYLTTTVDGGTSWRITGVLPSGSWDPSVVGGEQFAFVSTREGYIEQPSPRTPLFTSNGGRTWQSVAFVGAPLAISIMNGKVELSAVRCPKGLGGTNRCATHVGIFAFNTTAVEGAIYQMLNHGVSTGALFLGVGMLYDRRHTHEIKQYGGLATPMPVLMSFFLFICLSSLALPPLNGFIGEFLILIGTFQVHNAWASWAASAAVLSAIYLLWAYQRVALGEVTVEKNKSLPDASPRERVILVVMAVAILFMGIASPLFTRRMEVSVNNTLDMTSSPRNAARPAVGSPARRLVAVPAPPTPTVQAAPLHVDRTAIAALVERRAAQ